MKNFAQLLRTFLRFPFFKKRFEITSFNWSWNGQGHENLHLIV